ncbi:zf-C2HC5-domain-containing protein [Basidiobolus meristosporus CBS 931.73]|uniref:Zf-C2HC5-domain-containing protein n=1 Tax=Basidiobolus meristosporus CBS 931.73 TaxID=1314790 RepID=A0A1Y1VTS7_9FUNG|nr:zf-C2HC5-domain-containing protein [Basidiobolus meristosporus CBS 931.73]|eukprot:ORX64415.1 zf-C2HC5-domain-containing protein [Basidiobolus meristosporus CBS 931.73]
MNQNTLQDWASTRIADFLGFGPEDAVPMVQYLLTFQTSDELAGHLQEMLGVSQEATAFIQEFIENRFPSKGGINSTNQDTQPFKWAGSPEASASLKEEDSKNSKKKKGLTTAEWEEQYNKLMKETAATRAPCDCLATKHPLLTNCLNCGKIICAREGPGPCMFCNTPVFSQEQQIELLLELKKAKKAKSKSNFRRKVPAGQKSNMLYLDKVTGLSTHSRSDAEDAEALAKAQAHKDQLLEYDRTSARRSHVIDQAADFNMPVDPSDKWLSPQEKALALKLYQEQEKRKAFEEDRRKRGTHSITIDLLGRKVVTGPVIEAPDDGVKETLQELEKLKLEEARKSQSSKGSGYYAQNPLLKGVSAPKFISSKERSTSNQLSEEGLPRKKDSRRRVKLDHLDEDASKNASAAGAYSKET